MNQGASIYTEELFLTVTYHSEDKLNPINYQDR